ncbi:MAG TPA: exopolysaccharide biosynthesis polyprenyl glycosylphosphotransferase [Kiritimatiellia bacterium]|nr:exopolysaccharide biosynthesis polyprenyl glycosylphosphotransferase [Kiritimatiellia bacterium]
MNSEQQPYPYVRRALGNALALGIAEAGTLLFSLLLGGFIRFAWKGEPMLASWMAYLLGAWVIGAYVTKLLPGWGLGPVEELRRTFFLLVAVFAGTTAMLFWGKAAEVTSRFTLTVGFLLSCVLVPIVRLEIKRLLLRFDSWGIPAVLYGRAESVSLVARALREERGLGYNPAGIFLEGGRAPDTVAGLPVWGTGDQTTTVAPIALLATSGLTPQRVSELLDGTLASYRRIVVIPDITESPTLWVKPRDLMGLLGIEIPGNLLDPLARLVKRSLDLAIVIGLAPLWVPLGGVLSLLVWLEDRGPAIFRQERVGHRGRIFSTLKFRTMHRNAEAQLQKRLQENESLRAEWAANFKLREDPRITRIGRFLRYTSLDELPQFINVLRGEMSLVGPRPLPPYHNNDLPERVRQLRDRVRPGITGLWQVSGRSEAGHAAMPRWDTYYVRNWSIWLDLVILVRTIRAVATRQGAY